MNRKWLNKAKAVALTGLSRFWKWYTSGFAHRPNRKLYLSERFWRIALTPVVLLLVLGLLFPTPDEPSSVATAPESLLSPSPSSPVSSEDAGKVGSRLCIDNFNQSMSPGASATLDKDTKTMEVSVLEPLTTAEETEQAADMIANGVFSSCTDIFIETVNFQFDGFQGYLTRERP